MSPRSQTVRRNGQAAASDRRSRTRRRPCLQCWFDLEPFYLLTRGQRCANRINWQGLPDGNAWFKIGIAQQKSAGDRPRFFVRSVWSRKLLVDGGLGAVRLLDDAGRLAAQIAQGIKLGATHLTAAHH